MLLAMKSIERELQEVKYCIANSSESILFYSITAKFDFDCYGYSLQIAPKMKANMTKIDQILSKGYCENLVDRERI